LRQPGWRDDLALRISLDRVRRLMRLAMSEEEAIPVETIGAMFRQDRPAISPL
jgi:hypothetical protein